MAYGYNRHTRNYEKKGAFQNRFHRAYYEIFNKNVTIKVSLSLNE